MIHAVAPRRGMTVRTVIPFFLWSFALTWGLAGLFLVFPDTLTRVFGEMGYTNPLFVLAVYAPGIVGTLMVGYHHGARGLRAFFARLTQWRMPLAWWALLVLGIPAAFYVGAAMSGAIAAPFPFDPWVGVLPALAVALVIGPIEELGWRGVALPLLQRRFSPLGSALILGVVWALWHVPAFFLGGTPQSSWSFPAFFVGVVALSVILTAMFNAARGSLLVPVLFHFQTNGPAWPDGQPWDTLVFVVVAVLVVWICRKAMLTREGAATQVV